MIEPVHCSSNSILKVRFFWGTLYMYLQPQLGEYVADFGCIRCLVQQANDSLCGLQGVTGGGLGVNRALQIIRGRTRVSRNDNPGWLNTAGLAYVHFAVGFILRETQKNQRTKPNLMQESGGVKPILCACQNLKKKGSTTILTTIRYRFLLHGYTISL